MDEDGILGWRDRLIDGGFESGTEDIYTDTDLERFELVAANFERMRAAAKSGNMGLRVEAGENGGVLALRAKIDKGEDSRYTLWARSAETPADVYIRAEGVKNFATDRTEPLVEGRPQVVRIGTGWTQVRLHFPNTEAMDYGLFIIELKGGTTLDIDEASMEAEHWTSPVIFGPTRKVGEIDVPEEPVAPVHFSVLMHIEDPESLTRSASEFWQRTAVFEGLAEILHRYGGFLTIQPEEDWPLASLLFSDGRTLADLSDEYNVVYSTHTHGPKCIGALIEAGPLAQLACGKVLDCPEPRGAEDGTAEGARYQQERRLCEENLEAILTSLRPLSNEDCGDCICCEEIDEELDTGTDSYTPEYVRRLRMLLEELSGTSVSDHNGNWNYEDLSAYASPEVGIKTLTAFKKAETQSTFDILFTNPWRPTDASAVADPETFFIHDPATGVIFIPGWGQAITRHPEYLQERLAAMFAQVISHADPDRVNTFYIVTHVSHFEPESEDAYITVDPRTGVAERGTAFEQDLQYWADTMEQLVKPLVDAGYVQWTSVPEMGELFVEWEADCSTR